MIVHNGRHICVRYYEGSIFRRFDKPKVVTQLGLGLGFRLGLGLSRISEYRTFGLWNLRDVEPESFTTHDNNWKAFLKLNLMHITDLENHVHAGRCGSSLCTMFLTVSLSMRNGHFRLSPNNNNLTYHS
jgi:hypothetical protein